MITKNLPYKWDFVKRHQAHFSQNHPMPFLKIARRIDRCFREKPGGQEEGECGRLRRGLRNPPRLPSDQNTFLPHCHERGLGKKVIFQ